MSQDNAKPKTYFYFVDGVRYESELPALTAAQIKAKVPSWDPTFGLSLEGHGNDPDRLVEDGELISLEKDHGPRKFTSVPPANFGVS